MPPANCQEGVMQYCGYGYDKNLYSSYDDCINKKMQECPSKEFQDDDIIEYHENVDIDETEVTEQTPSKDFTVTQKWLAIIGITAVCYFILYKAGSLK